MTGKKKNFPPVHIVGKGKTWHVSMSAAHAGEPALCGHVAPARRWKAPVVEWQKATCRKCKDTLLKNVLNTVMTDVKIIKIGRLWCTALNKKTGRTKRETRERCDQYVEYILAQS